MDPSEVAKKAADPESMAQGGSAGKLLKLFKEKPGCAFGCFGSSMMYVFMIAFLLMLAVFALFPDTSLGLEDLGITDKRQDISPEEWKQIFVNAEISTGTPWEVSAAIVYNETGGGRNFGGCSYFPTAPSGGHVLVDGDGLRSTADKTAFEEIVTNIGYPKNEPVSCNPSGSNGGAMGYMQIMPREWKSYSARIVDAGLTRQTPNPWDAQEAAYVAALILKCKAGSSYCNLETPLPEDETTIKKAAGNYYGGGPESDYAARAYARYLEFKAAGEITE
jgi:hypothetical protein